MLNALIEKAESTRKALKAQVQEANGAIKDAAAIIKELQPIISNQIDDTIRMEVSIRLGYMNEELLALLERYATEVKGHYDTLVDSLMGTTEGMAGLELFAKSADQDPDFTKEVVSDMRRAMRRRVAVVGTIKQGGVQVEYTGPESLANYVRVGAISQEESDEIQAMADKLAKERSGEL